MKSNTAEKAQMACKNKNKKIKTKPTETALSG